MFNRSRWAKKTTNTQLFYICCYVALIIMSWSDPCGYCGRHRADCECLSGYASVTTPKHSCEDCVNECKKKTADGEEYGCCEDIVLVTQ